MGDITGVRDNEVQGRVDYKRQISIFDPADFTNYTVTIAGLGNIGSNVALALTKMGILNFELYDFDKVEAHNLASQAYNAHHVGADKVFAVAEQMELLNPAVSYESYSDKFSGGARVGHILISAVDSMEARREICKNIPSDVFVIDGRMGGGQIEVHSQYAKDWVATLEKDGDDDPCGARFISYTSYVIAGLIANQVKRHLLKQRMAKTILLHMDTMELIATF